MKRIMFQAYVKDSAGAVALYQRAFGATLGDHVKNDDGSFYHSELEMYGQILSVAELPEGTPVTGTAMQLCLHFGEDEKPELEAVYEVLKEGADVLYPLGPCDWGVCMADLVDRYGVRWGLFIA